MWDSVRGTQQFYPDMRFMARETYPNTLPTVPQMLLSPLPSCSYTPVDYSFNKVNFNDYQPDRVLNENSEVAGTILDLSVEAHAAQSWRTDPSASFLMSSFRHPSAYTAIKSDEFSANSLSHPSTSRISLSLASKAGLQSSAKSFELPSLTAAVNQPDAPSAFKPTHAPSLLGIEALVDDKAEQKPSPLTIPESEETNNGVISHDVMDIDNVDMGDISNIMNLPAMPHKLSSMRQSSTSLDEEASTSTSAYSTLPALSSFLRGLDYL